MPFEEQRRRPARLAEEARLAGRRDDRLDRLAQTLDPAVVAGGEEVVQRAVLEVRGQQVGKALGRQVGLLQEQRTLSRAAQALEVERRCARGDEERGSDALRGRLEAGGQQGGPRLEAAELHLLGKAQGR